MPMELPVKKSICALIGVLWLGWQPEMLSAHEKGGPHGHCGAWLAADPEVEVKVKDTKDGALIQWSTKQPKKAESIRATARCIAERKKRGTVPRYYNLRKKKNWRGMMGSMRHGMTRGKWHGIAPASTKESIAQGKKLYNEHCVSCHGASGKGDGPAAGSLSTKPTNLISLVGKFPDRHFYMQIAQGPGQNMPAWYDVFTSEDIWSLTHYVKSLKK